MNQNEKSNGRWEPFFPASVNRKYKDRLFRLVFREKEDLLDLYNAINGTDYTNPDDLTVTTLDDVIYMGMKNDLSFMIGMSMGLYEQQSTWSGNMPLRGLLYFAGLYQSYIMNGGYNLFGTKRIPLPSPHYIVFYNGRAEKEDRIVLRLSDAFEPLKSGLRPCLECEAVMLNINRGHNRELLEKCRKLGEYAEFIARMRERLNGGEKIGDAARETIRECIGCGILADVLTRCRTEVLEVLLTEYDEEKTWEYLRNEAWESGVEEGKKEGKKEGMEKGLKALIETCREIGMTYAETEKQIGKKYDLPEKKLQKFLEKYWNGR